jgi:Flp pilus assembly pilin Flp
MFPRREEGQQIVEFVLILVLILIVLVAVYLLLEPQIAKIISTPR